MVMCTGFQPGTVRRRFGAFLPVFAFFFCFLCPLRADIVYLDDAGNVISSEKTERDEHGNIVVIPAEKNKEEIAAPSRGAEEEIEKADLPAMPEHRIADGHGEHFNLNDAGMDVVFNGGIIDKAILRSAPPDAVNLVIPDGVTEIEVKAFRQCKKLESVVFPNSVNYIPASCFTGSYFGITLRSVSIPAHVSIGDRAFMFCQSLESVTITKGGETVAPPREDARIGEEAFSSCFALKRFEFPDGIRSIGNNAFLSCPLESAILPDSVTSIGENAFSGAAIKTVKLPAGITFIGSRAFLGCTSLKYLELPPVLIDIGADAFSNCNALEHFKLPQGISTIIQRGMFSYCRNLKTVELPGGITAIGETAFEGCSALKEISLPDSIETIGYRAFAACENLEKITLPANLKKIGFSAFRYCPKLKEIAIPDRTETFADAFDLSVTRLKLPAGNTRYKFTPEGALIDDADHVLLAFPCAFNGHYTIPDGITAVAPRAFRGCSLRGVTIPSSVTSLGSSAFAYSALEEIAIPSSVKEFQVGENIPGMTQHASAFETTAPDHYEEYDRSLFAHCTRLKRVKLSENMKEIPFAMFKQCHSLEEIAIPSSVKNIGECAFLDCRGLKRITVPSGVRVLPPRVFDGCVSLAEVKLPSGLESIDYDAFQGCTALTELAVPSSVKTISDFAFRNSACEKNLHDLIESLGELKLAEEGDMDLQYKMGYLYQFGIAFGKDAGEAVNWYRKAARQGHTEAQFMLGCCYERGDGVEQDLSEAANWYRKAAEQGHAGAKEAMERLRNQQESQADPKP